jgi:hypothetical protein
LLLAALAAIVLITHSDKAKMAGIVFMAMPLVQIVVGPIYTAWQSHQTDRRLDGDEAFRRPAQRNLAHAIRAHDVALVRSLIPGAGNLNLRYHDETLLSFAVYNGKNEPGSVEVVQALLDAGADPNLSAFSDSFPLVSAIYGGPRLTEALLKAGADPNRLDSAKRPLWWAALSGDTDEQVETLRILLDHGADLTKRDSEAGPVGWATYNAWMSHGSRWRLVWMLMERGASWKDEQEFGRSVIATFLDDFRTREAQKGEISEEMRRIMAKIAAESA